MPFVQLHNQKNFTTLWECKTPGCGQLTLVGDCGELGHMGRQNISSNCLGCRQPIGQFGGARDSNLNKLDMVAIKKNVSELLAIDELPPLRLEPLQETGFDDSWIMDKYNPDIGNKSTAIFIHLIQQILLLIADGNDNGGVFHVPLPDNNDNLEESEQRISAVGNTTRKRLIFRVRYIQPDNLFGLQGSVRCG